MAEVSTTPERYVDKTNMSTIMSGIKTYVDNSGGGGGGGSSDPDGTAVINRDSSGNITSTVFTYSGGVTTTTYAETSSTEYIVERDVKTGSAVASVKTMAITDNSITLTTTMEPIT